VAFTKVPVGGSLVLSLLLQCDHPPDIPLTYAQQSFNRIEHMANDDDGITLAIPERRPRALKDIGYNSLIYDTSNTSSGEDLSDIERIPSQDARRVLDVSLGPEQSRLTSPQTPAPEKAAVIEAAGGFFGDGVEDAERDITEEESDELEDAREHTADTVAHTHESIPVSRPHGAGQPIEWRQAEADAVEARASARKVTRSPAKTDVRLPSPWRAVPRKFQRTDQTRQFIRDGLRFSRRRCSSGSESTASGWRGALSGLPNFSLTTPFSSSQHDGANEADNEGQPSKRSSRSGSFLAGSFQWSSRSSMNIAGSGTRRERSSNQPRLVRRESSPMDSDGFAGTVGDLPSRPQLASLRSRNTYLRRSTSDDSLTAARTMSHASSLGDDTRFADVSAQVNNRMKAFKDSWADSSVKLPSMPSMASLTPDFIRERAGSVTRKPAGTGTRERAQSAADMRIPQEEKANSSYNGQPNNASRSSANESRFESTHPHMFKALSQLEGDIVILGGYRGSILRSAQAPHRQLWAPVKVGLNIRKVDLEVGLEPGDDERATEKVIPGGMLTHVGPVDIAKRLFKRLRNCENARSGKLRVHDYGYDWRLDPAYLSKQLQEFLKKLPCNQPGVPKEKRGAIVVAHSLGGLITRHAVNQQPTLFAGVIYAGVPRTCVNILGPLRNGDDVLLSSRVLTAQVNFTIRTSFALLPLNGRCFFDKETGEEYPVDFFDPQTWIDNRLTPCLARPLPPLVKPPEPTGFFSGSMSTMAKALPSLRKNSLPTRPRGGSNPNNLTQDNMEATKAAGIAAEPDASDLTAQGASSLTMSNNNIDYSASQNGFPEDAELPPSISTTVTIPRDKALAYLTRTLASIKAFKQSLAFHEPHANANVYPPVALVYGRNIPTVYGARVSGREGIKHADAYDALAFASGDGVVLAKAAMLPEGYRVARGGVISSERGHVTLLGDLEAMGRCLNAIIQGRKRGVGFGDEDNNGQPTDGSAFKVAEIAYD
jgi:pimeloyl-ACP methyl ester carboxylesterase